MSFLYYIKYFCYIAWNWNVRLALFTIYHEIRGEKKYRIATARLNNLRHLTITGHNLKYAEIYQGAGYFLLEKIFNALKKLKAKGGFVDVGCGKGRVLVVAAHAGFTNITGIDFAKELCDEAIINCRQITAGFPSVTWRVNYINAVDYRFNKNAQVIFFFNPFQHEVMEQVIKNLLIALATYRHTMWVVYMNPQHKALFTRYGFKEISYIKKMAFVEASIFVKEP